MVDDDELRSSRTCALLEGAGYRALVLLCPIAIADCIADGIPTVLLLDISSPGAARELTERHMAITGAVGDRCPIVLYGDRTETQATEPPGSMRATATAPSSRFRDGLLDLLMGLLPEPTPPIASAVRPSAVVDAPEDSDRPTNPIVLGVTGGVAPPFPHAIAAPPPPSFRTDESGAPSSPWSQLSTPNSDSGRIHGEWERVRLLLIDESEMTLELMQERLHAEGADVRIAVALGEVDSIVANWCPNLIVANVRRADLAGDALCARLKHAVGSSELRILLCSTLPDAELRLLAMAAGADGFVSKSRGLDSFVREVVEMTMKLSPPNLPMGRVRQA